MKANIVTTSTGITIGSAYVPPPPQPGHGMECVQAWLLPEPVESRFERIGHKVLPWALTAVIVSLAVLSRLDMLPGGGA